MAVRRPATLARVRVLILDDHGVFVRDLFDALEVLPKSRMVGSL